MADHELGEARRLGVVIQDEDGNVHVIDGVQDTISAGDTVSFSIESGPFSADYEVEGTVVGLKVGPPITSNPGWTLGD